MLPLTEFEDVYQLVKEHEGTKEGKKAAAKRQKAAAWGAKQDKLLHKMFHDMDDDRSGWVNAEELRSGLANSGLPIPPDAIDALIKKCDDDGEDVARASTDAGAGARVDGRADARADGRADARADARSPTPSGDGKITFGEFSACFAASLRCEKRLLSTATCHLHSAPQPDPASCLPS